MVSGLLIMVDPRLGKGVEILCGASVVEDCWQEWDYAHFGEPYSLPFTIKGFMWGFSFE